MARAQCRPALAAGAAMMTLSEAAAAMGGSVHGPDRPFASVSTDTRNLAPQALFFAIRGERFDAVRFLSQAFAGGAAGAVVPVGTAVDAAATIEVDDVRAALGRLAAHWRRKFHLPVVAVTGSNGKTTVKDMIAAVLGAHVGSECVLATEGNLNNDIGMPLTLLALRAQHRYAVIEMGMNHAGEIGYLTRIACPDVALVTNAGTAHIGMLGSVDAIARAKGEIYDGLESDGVAIVNADDAHAPLWRAQNARRRTVSFGLDATADVTGRYAGHALHSDITVRTPAWQALLRLEVPGVHNVRNALAATAAAYVLEIDAASVQAGLAAFRGPEGRMQRRRARRGAILIDDTYNANPDSAIAAIDVLAAMEGNRVLVLGDMAELGSHSEEQHARVGAAARAAGIELLLTLGTASAAATAAFASPAQHFTRIEDLLAVLEPQLDARTVLLVKGSRCMQMERVVSSLEAGRP
jgi:UDP-N-acetylmuramoyl-tripeptide--D-alanyl-D-alanine ligase